MKKLSAFILALFLVFFNTFGVYAEEPIPDFPTKEEILKAITLRLITSKVDLAVNAGSFVYNITNMSDLQNYPVLNDFIDFQGAEQGLNGLLFWNDIAKEYYKGVLKDFLYYAIDKDGLFLKDYNFGHSTVTFNNKVYVIPDDFYESSYEYKAIYCDTWNNKLFCVSFENPWHPPTNVITNYEGYFAYDSSSALQPYSGYSNYGGFCNYVYWSNYGLSPYEPTSNTSGKTYVTGIDTYSDSLPTLFPEYDNQYIVANYDNVQTFDDVKTLPIDDLIKVFPTEQEANDYLDSTAPTVPTNPGEYPWSGLSPNLVLQMKEKYYSSLNCNFLFETFDKLKNAEYVQADPPKFSLNLHNLEGNNNNFADKETVIFDFKILENVNIGGFNINLLDYVRNLIGMGFVYLTFCYVYRKFVPDKIID